MDKPITNDIFNLVWDQNPHGCGVGYFRGGEPVIYTTMDKGIGWKMYENAVKEVMENSKTSPTQPKHLILHCRVATHGTPKIKSNVHPFFVPIAGGMLLGHNGQTDHTGIIRPNEWSDTRTLAELWIPKNAPHLLTDEKQAMELRKQLNGNKTPAHDTDGARVAVITQFAARTFNFPFPKEDYKKYGLFSNYIFDYKSNTKYEPPYNSRKAKKNKKLFLEDKKDSEKELERWTKNNGQFRYLSANIVHRALCYCIKHNMSFAGSMLMFREIFDDFPGHMQIQDFAHSFEKCLETISDWYQEPRNINAIDILKSEFAESEDQLMDLWMEEQGIKYKEAALNPPPLTEQEKIEEERALQGASNFPVETGFPWNQLSEEGEAKEQSENKSLHSIPLLGFGQTLTKEQQEEMDQFVGMQELDDKEQQRLKAFTD